MYDAPYQYLHGIFLAGRGGFFIADKVSRDGVDGGICALLCILLEKVTEVICEWE